ncbi:MAG: hypothetical protein M0027_11720 [Candidatus Dormibacteraeota bacterium]|nr:hypothetical protein [Candidatus Dormibacteraeota bacterium]
MIDPEAPQQEQTVTQVAQTPTGTQQYTYRASGPAATPAFRLRQLVWLAAGVVDVILALDFLFKLMGANQIGFVSFIGGLANALSAPFRGILATTVTAGAHVAYWPDVVAIVVYGIAAWIVVALIGIVAAPRRGPSPQV